MPPTKHWKNVERRIARIFETERTPLSGGSSRHTRSDTLEPFIFVEAKYRKKHAVLSLYEATEKLALLEQAPDGKPKIPIVALTQRGSSETYIMLKASDLDAVIVRSAFFRDRIRFLARRLLRATENGGD